MPNRRRPRAVTSPVRIEDTYTERQWAAVVEGLLAFYGWRYHHSPDNRPTAGAGGRAGRQRVGDRGFPDYMAVRRLGITGWPPVELALLELKTQTGRLGPGQAEWLEDLEAATAALWEVHQGDEGLAVALPRIVVGVYRPADKRALEEVLRGPGGRNAYIGRDDL